jgi:hypothetical protein
MEGGATTTADLEGEEGRTGVLLAATSVVKKAILPMPAQHEWR